MSISRMPKQSLTNHEDSVADYRVDPAFTAAQAIPQFQQQMAETPLPMIRPGKK